MPYLRNEDDGCSLKLAGNHINYLVTTIHNETINIRIWYCLQTINRSDYL